MRDGREKEEMGREGVAHVKEVLLNTARFLKYKAKFGGMDVSDAKRLKVLEDENAKLKRLLAEAMLDNTALKDLMSRKW